MTLTVEKGEVKDSTHGRSGGWVRGKHVLITGGSSGIGREVCRRLSGIARKLTLVARNRDRALERLVEELESRQTGPVQTQFAAKTLDVCDFSGAAELVRGIYEGGDQVDAFINCAGGSHFFGPLETMAHRDIERIFDTNAKAPIFWLREFLPRMKMNKMGKGDLKRAHVVMLSSRSGERALPKLSVYAAAKGSVEKLIEAVRTEYASLRIAFTLINPGSIDTPFTAQWDPEIQSAHNAESMTVQESVEPILLALKSQFAVNKISYQSAEQWTLEPGVMKVKHG